MQSGRWAAVMLVLGSGSGVAGAVAYSHFSQDSKPEVAPERRPAAPQPLVIPPGWNLKFASRLSDVEEKLDALDALDTAVPEPSEDLEESAELTREEERAEHYQQELDFRDQKLTEHEQEPLDAAWATPQMDTMQRTLDQAFQDTAETTSVDCRSATCTATLTFPAPSDALAAISRNDSFDTPGCSGMIAIPTPPEGEGPYELTLWYNCR